MPQIERQPAGPRQSGFQSLQARGQAMLGKGLRYNRFLAKLSLPEMLLKVPRDVGVDEENVSFGMGITAAIAAGGAWQLVQQAPRECILRDLVVVALGNAGLPDREFAITSIQIEGKNVLIGGSAPGFTFDPLALGRPEFDTPVAGGCTVAIQGINGSAGNRQYTAHWKID